MTYHTVPLVEPDTIWLTRGPFPTGTALGLHLGWFEKAFAHKGLKTSTLQDSNNAALRSQHFYHDIKTLIREGGNILPLWRRAHNLHRTGYDNTVVVGITWVDEVQVLLARPGLGLGGGDLTALRGKVLGLSAAVGEIDIWRAMALRGFDTALQLAGLTQDDVIFKDIKGAHVEWQNQGRVGGTGSQATEAALLAGEVDVIYAKGAAAILLQETHGLDVVLDINALDDPALRTNNGTPRLITVHKHLLSDNPDVVQCHLQVLNRTAQWSRAHGDRIPGIIAGETGTSVASVQRGYGPRLADSFDVNLNAARVSALQSQADFLLAHGLIEARVDVQDWIRPEPLLAAFADPLALDTLEDAA